MPSPIERLIDQATGYKPPQKELKARPRNDAEVDAFIFRIDEQYFHVEIDTGFAIMTAETLKELRDSVAKGETEYKECAALVRAIDVVLNESIEDWKKSNEEFERSEKKRYGKTL